MFGRRLWDAPFLLTAYCKIDQFRSPAVQGPTDGIPASAGQAGRMLDFRIPVGPESALTARVH